MTANERCQIFLDLYRELEECLAAREGGSRTGLVQDFASAEGRRYREDLEVFRATRNLLSHHGKIDGEYIVAPSEAAVRRMREILDFAKNPPVAMTAAVSVEEMFLAGYEDQVAEIAGIMDKRGFSHAPVIDERGVLVGVFSVSTFFTYLRQGNAQNVKQLKIGDLRDVIKVENHTTEQFAFVDRNASCYKIEELFRSEGPDVRRVAAVFVTSNGKKNGKLLGMITPWDIIKLSKR